MPSSQHIWRGQRHGVASFLLSTLPSLATGKLMKRPPFEPLQLTENLLLTGVADLAVFTPDRLPCLHEQRRQCCHRGDKSLLTRLGTHHFFKDIGGKGHTTIHSILEHVRKLRG